MLVSVFDTRIADNNLGNHIIMDAVDGIVDKLFPDAFLLSHSCLDPIGMTSEGYIQRSKYTFFGGTNMLNAAMDSYTQWHVASSRGKVKDVILLGVGWWQYQGEINAYTAELLHDVLNHKVYHAVRDGYTEKKLRSIGFQNVFNTSCPTMWELTNEHCAGIPEGKARDVVVTVTNYNQNSELDSKLLHMLSGLYDTLYVWVQGPEDKAYAKRICPKIEVLPPRLSALDELLASSQDVEYVGTRLHAGVRALQHKRRTTILGIDNRALEIRRDTGLPVVERDALDVLRNRLESNSQTVLNLPWEAIENWKYQFV